MPIITYKDKTFSEWVLLAEFLERCPCSLEPIGEPPAIRALARLIDYDPLMTSSTGYYNCDSCGARMPPSQDVLTHHKLKCAEYTSIYTTSDAEVLVAIFASVYLPEGMGQFEAENFLAHVQQCLPDVYWSAFQTFRSVAVWLNEEPHKARVARLERLFWEALTVECRRAINDLRRADKGVFRKSVANELVRRFKGIGVDNARRVFDLMKARNKEAMDLSSANGNIIIEPQTTESLLKDVSTVFAIPDEAIQAVLSGLVKSLEASEPLANGWIINSIRLGQNEAQGVTLIMCDEGDRMTIRAGVWGKNNDEAVAKAIQFSHEKTPRQYYEAVYGLPYEASTQIDPVGMESTTEAILWGQS